MAPGASPSDLVMPGHVTPIQVARGGTLVCAGLAEAASDIGRLAGVGPEVVVCEVLGHDGNLATTAELAKKSELSEGQVEALLRAGGDDVSLSAAVGDDGTLELGDTLEQETIPSAEIELIRTSFENQIQNMVGDLEPKEREVIRMRFGLDGEESKTLQKIGDELGLSRERVRQIESKAKEKLRRSHEVQGLRGALN